MGLRTFPGKFLVRVWSLVAIRAEMSKQHDQTCPNLSTIQWPCTLSAQCLFLDFRMLLFFSIFLDFRMLLFFSITFYPAEIAYFNSPDRELSNGVRVMELYWNRNVDPSRSPCLKAIDKKSFEHGNFLVLRPVLLKIAYFNSGNRQLSISVLPKKLRERKKLSIPLEPHHNAHSSEIFLSFPPKNWKSCNCFIFSAILLKLHI